MISVCRSVNLFSFFVSLFFTSYALCANAEVVVQKNTIAEHNAPVGEALCGDLLSIYGEKPAHLVFQHCQFFPDSQIPAVAVYRVDNEYAEDVEHFLVTHYGMDKLQWECRYGVSVWSPSDNAWNGAGEIISPQLKKINSNYELVVEMTGSRLVRTCGKNGEEERRKIKSFEVTVTILDI